MEMPFFYFFIQDTIRLLDEKDKLSLLTLNVPPYLRSICHHHLWLSFFSHHLALTVASLNEPCFSRSRVRQCLLFLAFKQSQAIRSTHEGSTCLLKGLMSSAARRLYQLMYVSECAMQPGLATLSR